MLRKKQAAVIAQGGDEKSAAELYSMLFGPEIKMRGKTYSYEAADQPLDSKEEKHKF